MIPLRLPRFFLALGVAALGLSQAATTALAQVPATASADWASLEYPSQVKLGDTIDVKVNYKESGPGKLAVDIYWLKADGSFGGMLRYGQRKDATAGNHTFRFLIDGQAELASFHAMLFVSPDGNWDSREKQLRGPDVWLEKPTVAPVSSKTIKSKEDWAEMEHPDRAAVGKPFVVDLTHMTPNTGKLAVDLYWMKPDGSFGGMLNFGPRKDAVPGQKQSFQFVVKAMEGMGAVQVTAFLSPDGDWSNRQKEIRGPAIPVASQADAR